MRTWWIGLCHVRPVDAAVQRPTYGPLPAPLPTSTRRSSTGHRHEHRGTFLGMKFEIMPMLGNGGGTIVNMASVLSERRGESRCLRGGQGRIID